MNLPNKLTISRLVLTLVFVACFHLPLTNPFGIALLIFAAASITDYFDGAIARKRNLVTNFGKLFDPLADKILIAAAFIVLVENGMLPAWIAIVIQGIASAVLALLSPFNELADMVSISTLFAFWVVALGLVWRRACTDGDTNLPTSPP